MWRYINRADIYCLVKYSFNSNHSEITVGIDLLLGYVFPNEDRCNILTFDPAQKCYSTVMHRKEVTHSNGQ